MWAKGLLNCWLAERAASDTVVYSRENALRRGSIPNSVSFVLGVHLRLFFELRGL